MPDQAPQGRPRMFCTLEEEHNDEDENIEDAFTPEEQLETALQEAISNQHQHGTSEEDEEENPGGIESDDHTFITSEVESSRHKRAWTEFETSNKSPPGDVSISGMNATEEKIEDKRGGTPEINVTVSVNDDESTLTDKLNDESVQNPSDVTRILLDGYDNVSDEEHPSSPVADSGICLNDLPKEDGSPAAVKASLAKLGIKHDGVLPVETVSAADLRDTNWEFIPGTSNQNSAAALVNDFAKLQRQRHQIGWLAASAMRDANRILEMSGKMKEAKRVTRSKYGW